jgi:DNA-binding SARP family transcriptional activator
MMHEAPSFKKKPNNFQRSLRFHLFGPPSVTWNDQPLAIPRRSVRALLYRLACDTEPVTRGKLQLLFWPDMPESVARRNLSHHLTHMRRALPLGQVFVTTDDRVWLEPELVWCDVVEFKEASFDLTLEVSPFQNLTSLYRGPFLDGFDLPGCVDFEHWCLTERSALERQYLKVLERLVDCLIVRGETGQAVKYAQHYLESDSLSEAMHQRLIQLYAASGERHLALQQFELCSSILESELGVSPLPETREIYRAVLYGQLRFPEPSPPMRPPQLPNMEVPIIGREDELLKLEEVFLKLQECQSQVLLISGEAGIGKSRLMQDFAKQHRGEACLLYGSGHAGEQAIPYQPIQNILRAILGLEEMGEWQKKSKTRNTRPPPDFIEPVWLSEISRLIPEMHSIYPDLSPPTVLEPESARTRLFDALCHLILAYAVAQGPLLLCLDDLQWIDAATRAWLVHIGRFLAQKEYPILILGTYRSE